MKFKFQSKYLIPLASIVFGAAFAGYSIAHYSIVDPVKGPMAGFMPVLIGGLLILVSIVDLFQARHNDDPVFKKDNWLLVLGVLLVIAGSYVIGLLPCAFILAFIWLKFREKYSWRITIITMVFLLVLIYGVFVFWLEIPFDYGMLGKLFKR